MPNEAPTVFEKCVHEKALALSGKVSDHRYRGLVRTSEGYSGRFRTTQDYRGLFRTVQHYSTLFNTIERY